MGLVSNKRAEERLRQAAPPEFDYVFLTSLFGDYARPRQEISRLLKSGAIVRVKKGLYVAPTDSGAPYSKEILANLIYGPSYISLESALRIHRLIPERVDELTSVTCNRDKTFKTPVGIFSYRYLRPSLFALGVTQAEVGDSRHFLLATPEKALIDKVWFARKNIGPNDLEEFLFDDLRIERTALRGLNFKRLSSISSAYNDPTIAELNTLLRRSKDNQ
jgi:hypothetical protein